MNFKPGILANFKFLGVIRFVDKLLIKLVNSISISNQNLNGNVEMMSFSKQLVQRCQNSQQTKNNLNITAPLTGDFILNGKD